MSAVANSREYSLAKRRQKQQDIAQKSVARMARQAAIQSQKSQRILDQAYRLLMCYEGVFRALAQEFMGCKHLPDPLHNHSDFLTLLGYLAKKRITYVQQEEFGYYRVLLTAEPPLWGTGTGEGDSLPEALTFALWEFLENVARRTDS